MCTQSMEWDLPYILQMSKPRTLQELATKVRDMEITIDDCGGNAFSSTETKKHQIQFKKNVKSSKNMTKEVITSELIQIMGTPKCGENN